MCKFVQWAIISYNEYMQNSLLQTPQWGQFKTKWGWQAHQIGGYIALEKPLLGGRSFLYLPEVGASCDEIAAIKTLIVRSDPVLSKRIIFIQLELISEMTIEYTTVFDGLGFVKSNEEVQPKWRQHIPLDIEPQAIYNQLRPRGRRNIKTAEKNDVQISMSEDLSNSARDGELFGTLFNQTARRHGFGARPTKYYQDLLEMLYGNQLGFSVFARHQGELVAMAIISVHNGVASYLYGASSDAGQKVMASYLMLWQAMLEAKSRSASIFDMLAIAPPNSVKHRYQGITQFKQAFGGQTVELVGSYLLIFNQLEYRSFVSADRLRRSSAFGQGVRALRSFKELLKK